MKFSLMIATLVSDGKIWRNWNWFWGHFEISWKNGVAVLMESDSITTPELVLLYMV